MRAGFFFQGEVEQRINCRSELPTAISDLPLQFGNKLQGIAPVLRSPIQEAPFYSIATRKPSDSSDPRSTVLRLRCLGYLCRVELRGKFLRQRGVYSGV